MMGSDIINGLINPHENSQRFYGVVVGVVTNNQDPEDMHRVKVRFPWLGDDIESNWARVTAFMAGNDRGAYFLPEVDDEVLVAFEHGRVDYPFVLGSLWNGQDIPPESNQNGENNHRVFRSRSGHVLLFNDTDGSETIEIVDKSEKNKIVIDTANNSITIEADSDIAIKSANGKLTMEANGIEIRSQEAVSIEASQGMDITSKTSLSVNASASMDIKSDAQLSVKGAMINLN